MVANVAGECARVNDDLRQAAGGTVTSAAVVAAVLANPNYKYPAAKNPYGGTADPYASGTQSTLGMIGLLGNDTYADPAVNTNVYHAVVINGTYLENGANVNTTKVVALD
jgi:hypothetical protein